MAKRNKTPTASRFPGGGRSRKGESMIWLCSAGLALGVAMTLALLALVSWKGLESFWPRRIALMEVVRDGKPEMLAGYVVRKRRRRTPDGGEVAEVQIYRGNRDLCGEAFLYADREDVRIQGTPRGYWLVERMEHGNAIAEPLAWVDADGARSKAGGDAFLGFVRKKIREAARRRAELRNIERGEIGAINREMEALRLRAKAGGIPAAQARRREEALQSRYETLATEARRIRAESMAEKLEMKTADGRVLEIPQGNLVHVFAANRVGFFGRLGECLGRMGSFVGDEPREANTEGGVFPAIFGTVVMTLLMSFFVTPFGVVAAIYLREYARQGMLVQAVRISVNNLAGVPSIVFGVFGLAFFVYFVGGSIDSLFFPEKLPAPTYGTGGILWASLTLALMTLPVVIVATEEAIAAVPRGMREAALACGASKWQTIQRVVLPASLPGILTGVILSMARGAGEVAPLMIVGVVKWAPALPVDDVAPFIHPERKFMHLGFHIYDLGFQSPDSEAALPMVFATTLLLILVVVAMNLAAIVLRNRLRKKYAVSHF